MGRSGEHIILCERCQHSVERPSLRPIDPLLLHSSHTPTEAEYTQTVETLEEETQRLQCYEDTINHLHRSLEKMESAKRELEAHIKRRRSVISIQRRVPTEIWETIFAFMCSFSSARGYSLTIGGFGYLKRRVVLTQVPIVLSHVCHHWRAIVAGFPLLWSSISIDLHAPIPHGHKTLIETFLAKSEGHSLDLYVGVSTVDLLDESCCTLLEMLKRHFSRCGALDLNVEGNLLTPPLGSRYSFPHLLSFRRHHFYENDVHDHPFWKALRQAPKLTKVHFPSLPIHYPVPYTQLTTLIIRLISHGSIAELFKVLEASKNLCSLSLGIDTVEKGGLVHVARRVEMLFLRTFSLDLRTIYPANMENPTLKLLFSSLVMPVMTHFKFAGEQHISPIPRYRNGTAMWTPSLLTMLRHSSSTLRRMTLQFDPLDQDYWQDFSVLFEITPHLTHLDVGSYGRGTNWTLISLSIHRLSTDGIQNIILPHLQYIGLGPIHLEDDLMQRILDLAASRSSSRLSSVNGVQPLKEICIYYVIPKFCLKPWMLEEIERLRKDGLRVVMVPRMP